MKNTVVGSLWIALRGGRSSVKLDRVDNKDTKLTAIRVIKYQRMTTPELML